jgi:hypothetical protein
MENDMEIWRRNVAYFDKERDRIKKEYGEDTFVVIQNQQIVDSGPNRFDLSRQYHGQHVLINSIKASERKVEIPSPEVRRFRKPAE